MCLRPHVTETSSSELWINFYHLVFSNMHLNLSAQAFLHFIPYWNVTAAAKATSELELNSATP